MLVLPRLISRGCVLQMGERTRIWGEADPEERVMLFLQSQSVSCKAGPDGKWQGYFENLEPGGPFLLEIQCESGEKRSLEDIYVGDVFVCSGQSNMELPMNRVTDRYPEEFVRPNEPRIRLYKVKEHYEFCGPLSSHVDAGWNGCSKDTISEFSAVSYFFGRFLLEDREIPIGLINVSLGGTPVEAWLGEEAFYDDPEAMETLKKYRSEEFVKQQLERNASSQSEWYGAIERMDIGSDGPDDLWKPIALPVFFEDVAELDGFCGSVWLRKRIVLPGSMAGKEGKLWLGTLVDSDKTYINGILIGETGYQYPPRKYLIPKGILKSGENEICIRLVCEKGMGRITPGKIYALYAGEEQISLEGEWEYRVGYRCGSAPEVDFVIRKPTGLYNGMLAPCIPYMVKGVLWYQGEANDSSPDSYGELLKRMILFWRKEWQQERLPFVIAQLPGFDIDLEDKKDAWSRIRAAQAEAAILPDVAVTVNLDLGEANDLHPMEKKQVAFRMALAVRGMIYGEPVVWKGPVLSGCNVCEGNLCLFFETGDGQDLVIRRGNGHEAFELAGTDEVFYPVSGKAVGNRVCLWSGKVEIPVYLRYAWFNAPEQGLLYNSSGIPASPFCIRI
ncbi:MAG: sialate O-acetylesterase [Hungatella sp.]|nr:sialate O-acetylesterase [Hungatella sp.]